MKVALVALLLIVSMTGCGKEEVELSPKITNLIGKWRLTEPSSAYGVTLEFTYDSANPPHDVTPFLVNGMSSVNDYNIRFFAAIDGMMTTSNLSSTKKGGSTDAMQFEQTYFENLRAVVRYELPTDNQLRIYHGGSEPHLLIYERVK